MSTKQCRIQWQPTYLVGEILPATSCIIYLVHPVSFFKVYQFIFFCWKVHDAMSFNCFSLKFKKIGWRVPPAQKTSCGGDRLYGSMVGQWLVLSSHSPCTFLCGLCSPHTVHCSFPDGIAPSYLWPRMNKCYRKCMDGWKTKHMFITFLLSL